MESQLKIRKGVIKMDSETIFNLHLASHVFAVTTSIVTQWVIMAIIIVLAIILTRNIKTIPSKTQSVVEIFVETIDGLIKSNMGDNFKSFVPFIGTLAIFLFFLNLTGLVGVDPSTKDINVTAAFAIMSFVVIQATSIKRIGVGGYLKSYLQPFAPMIIMNVIEKITLPLSLCLRLFCNMLVGVMIIGLIYTGLNHFAFGIPIIAHGFFDLFDGIIQMYVFVMLTMVYTKMAISEE
ncbi:MAG: F0F1-type synthase, alpha subunit [Clostridium sp.]|jgi:F-type H+-transporting ATPase subunit a|nr:F0F1-type synthase, alpha subunit [Clostridium sp.]